ncbi:MAG: SPFH domain-containing protein [Myxococcales bacterium]|nr:SPFH domain-containing protein [Myxococcales bacterium]
MPRHTFTGQRAITFARGLYHVAACDGLDSREKAAFKAFLAQVGLPDDPAMYAADFDPAEAARTLDSTWLRRTFIRACRLMVQVDGRISTAERDTLRALAAALKVGERVALEDLEGKVSPDALAAWVQALAVDYVSWDDETTPGWLWVFPHDQHPLAEGGELVVEPGQALGVRVDGQFVDLLPPGVHHATPTTLPGLARARGWAGGAVAADLCFVRTGPSTVLRWGTLEPIQRETTALGRVPLRVFGRFSARVADPRRFLERFARQALPTDDDLDGRVRRMVGGWFEKAVQGLPGDDATLYALLEDLDELRAATLPVVQEGLSRAGLSLARFAIEHLTAPLELGLKPTSKRTRTLTRVASLSTASRPDTDPVQPMPAAAPRAVTDAALRPCHGCNRPMPVDARFCAHCGVAQVKPCGQCGHRLPLTARFCSQCGAGQG